MHRPLIAAAALSLLAAPALAQNTGGVFGPTVSADDRSAQYRITLDPDGRARDVDVAQRIHYQHGLSDSLRVRGVVASRTTADSGMDFDFVQAELAWQITEDGKPFQTGLRFDARLRDGGRAEQIGVNWTSQYSFGDGWRARGVVLAARQVADVSSDDLALSGRASIAKRLATGATVGVDAFSDFGTADRFRLFKRTSDSIGPFVSFRAGDTATVMLQPLIGVSSAARDVQLRVWVGRSF